jgi:hypothetical protein
LADLAWKVICRELKSGLADSWEENDKKDPKPFPRFALRGKRHDYVPMGVCLMKRRKGGRKSDGDIRDFC